MSSKLKKRRRFLDGSDEEDSVESKPFDDQGRRLRLRERTRRICYTDNEGKEDEEDLNIKKIYDDDPEIAILGAISADLPPSELSQEEQEHFGLEFGSQEQCEIYLSVRNMILGLWYRDPTHFIAREQCEGWVLEKYRGLVRRIHEYLWRFGFINFGVFSIEPSPVLLPPNFSFNAKSSDDKCCSVIVIGAGIAGVTAARQLLSRGFRVTLVEARQRVGGRICTDLAFGAAVDLGASIVVGTEGNAMAVVCKQLGLDMFHLEQRACPILDIDGRPVSLDVDAAMDAKFNMLLDAANRLRSTFPLGDTRQPSPARSVVRHRSAGPLAKRRHDNDHDARAEPHSPGSSSTAAQGRSASTSGHANGGAGPMGGAKEVMDMSLGDTLDELLNSCDGEAQLLTPQQMRILNWHLANLEYGNASDLKQVSLAHWDQDDQHEFGGPHCLIPSGYGRVVARLAAGIDIRFAHVVKEVQYRRNSVAVRCENGARLSAEKVVVTLPLGLLKDNAVKFVPALPRWKKAAIGRLGYGLLNKVALLFPVCFWDKELDFFGATQENPARRGELFLFLSLCKCVGKPILVSIIAGAAAHDMEAVSDAHIVSSVLDVLRRSFGHAVLPPIKAALTRWKTDPFARGSYSFVAVGSSGDDYDDLARPIDDTVFFAGEATHRQHPATASGALLSGLRQAANIIHAVRGPIT